MISTVSVVVENVSLRLTLCTNLEHPILCISGGALCLEREIVIPGVGRDRHIIISNRATMVIQH